MTLPMICVNRSSIFEDEFSRFLDHYDITFAHTAEAAFEAIQTIGAHVVLISLKNPIQTTSMESFITELKEKNPTIQIIACAQGILMSESQVPLIVSYMKAGLGAILEWPPNPIELNAVIQIAHDNGEIYKKIAGPTDSNAPSPHLLALNQLIHYRRPRALMVVPTEIEAIFQSHEPHVVVETLKENHSDARKFHQSIVLLSIEDNDIYRDVMLDYFRSRFSGITANTVEKGLEIIRQKHVDIVFLDIGLPGITGVDAIPMIKAINPSIEIIILSGYLDYSLIVKSIQAGALDFILKPPEFDYLDGLLLNILQPRILKGVK
jgi:DNA-binding NtrC family response regulator